MQTVMVVRINGSGGIRSGCRVRAKLTMPLILAKVLGLGLGLGLGSHS